MPTGRSQYHAMEFVLERRFAQGFQARFGYTYSRLNNNGAESAQGDNGINGGVQDPSNPLPWGLSADDAPHVFLTGFTWEVPGPTAGMAQKLLAGWHVSGILRYESGRPLHITDILAGVQKRFGVELDRESVVSAMSKRVARQDRFMRTAPNTFALIPEREDS